MAKDRKQCGDAAGVSMEHFCEVPKPDLDAMDEIRGLTEEIDVSDSYDISLVTSDEYNVPDDGRNLLGEWMEAAYEAEKSARDAFWRKMGDIKLQMGPGKCLFAPTAFYAECGYHAAQAEDLFFDGFSTARAGDGAFIGIQISSE